MTGIVVDGVPDEGMLSSRRPRTLEGWSEFGRADRTLKQECIDDGTPPKRAQPTPASDLQSSNEIQPT